MLLDRRNERRLTFRMSKQIHEAAALVRAVVLASLVPAFVSACAGYVPGRQSYWDNKIRDLCSKEGKVQIFDQVILTKAQAEQMPRLEGKLATRGRAAEFAQDPVYSERKTTQLNENPQVVRDEVSVIRSADGKVVAHWIEYSRIGGDVPTGIAHPSSYRCPDPRERLDDLQRLFIVVGD
jgi:hypothetical protein